MSDDWDDCEDGEVEVHGAKRRSPQDLGERAFWFAWAGLALSFVGFWFIAVVRGRGIFVVLGLWLLGFVLACAGFVLAVRARAKRKSIVVIMIVTGLIVLYGALQPALVRLISASSRVAQCRWHLGVVGERLIAHTRQSEGGIVVGEGWCDILGDDTEARDSLRCNASSAERGQCSYALNEAVGGKAIDSLPGNMVLLFESAPGWNAFGGAELLFFDNHRLLSGQRANVMLVDGTIVTVTKKQSQDLAW